MKTKSTYNYKNIILFAIFLVTAINALSILWQLIIAPFYTNQLTTLTWFGVSALVASICIAGCCWSEIWSD